MHVLIKGGRVIDPATACDDVRDVLVANGRIRRVAPTIDESADQVVDATGLIVAPGFIDMRCRFGVSEREDREDFASGSRAALQGGFTDVVLRPHPLPFDVETVFGLYERARREAFCRIHLVASLARATEGKALSEVHALQEAGAVALDENGLAQRLDVLRRGMQYAAEAGVPIFLPCGIHSLDAGGVVHEGAVSSRLGLPGIPRSSETLAVMQALVLAEETGCRVHIGPITTAESVQMIQEAKERGVAVTADTTVHHTILTEEAIAGFHPHTKVYPPFREKRDVEAVRRGLTEGAIDVLTSDHTPLRPEEAELELEHRPFGASALETAISLALTHLVHAGHLTFTQWIARSSWGPARLLGIDGGRIAEGALANIVLIDANAEWKIRTDQFVSRGRNSPFDRHPVRGRVVETFVEGRETRTVLGG